MARLPRLTVPGYPHHIIQRGNNRQAIFADDTDREFLLSLFEETARKEQVAIHGYVLMDNHFHLLATPEGAESIPLMMQSVGRRYVRRYNDRHGRTGTLWEGRYKSTLVQAERYLLACMVYIDLNPVRAGMVREPADYPWSSHRHFMGLRADRVVSPHALFWALGNTPFARQAAYTELIRNGISQEDQRRITEATIAGWALGEGSYVDELQARTQRRITKGKAGRPVMATTKD